MTIEEGGSAARPPRRLRDLPRRDRWIAAAFVVLVVIPFVVALVRAFGDGWAPSGDEANIATRSLDVLSRHPPLTGLPSTSALYGAHIPTNHPGPIEFYLIALPIRLLGMNAGPLLTAAVVNCACVLVALWVFLRRLGPAAAAWAGVLVLALIWSAGTAVLTDTLSSSMTMYSVLCCAVLAWALVDGDTRMLPLTALVGSYAAQQHLAAGLVVLALAVLVVGAWALQAVARRRGADAEPPNLRGPLVIAGAIAAVCWLPVLVDEATGHPGNLTAVVRLARHGRVPSLGLTSGLRQVAHALAPPTVLGRTGTTGLFLLTSPGTLVVVGAIVAIVLVAVTAWTVRRRAPSVATLAVTALVFAAAGVFNGSKVPASYEAGRANLYRWAWTAAFLVWVCIGLGLGHLLSSRARPIARRAAPFQMLALLVVAVLITSAIVVTNGRDDHNALETTFRPEQRFASAVLARVDSSHPVVVVEQGNAASLAIGPYLIARLVRAGIAVEVSRYGTANYGKHRRFRRGTDATAIVVVSGTTRLPASPGTLIASELFGPERTHLLDELARAAAGHPIRLAPGAAARIERRYPTLKRLDIERTLGTFAQSPRAALARLDILDLFAAGDIASPALDLAKVRRLRTLAAVDNTFAGDERFAARLLTPEDMKSPEFTRLLELPPSLV